MTPDDDDDQRPRPLSGWSHHRGQLSFDSTTRVLADSDTLPGAMADRWALVPVTWQGLPWFYGYCPILLSGTVVCGWWLVPRDPYTDPHFADTLLAGGDRDR
jgi:hypothetical protein